MTEFDDKEGENLSLTNNGNTKDFPVFAGVSLEDSEWLSPPDSICSSGSEAGITSPRASFPGSFSDPDEERGQLPQELSGREASGYQDSAPVDLSDYQEIPPSGQSEPKNIVVDDIYTGSFDPATNEPCEYLKAIPSSSDESKIAAPDALHSSSKYSDKKSVSKDEITSPNKVKIKAEDRESPFANTIAVGQVSRGKYE